MSYRMLYLIIMAIYFPSSHPGRVPFLGTSTSTFTHGSGCDQRRSQFFRPSKKPLEFRLIFKRCREILLRRLINRQKEHWACRGQDKLGNPIDVGPITW